MITKFYKLILRFLDYSLDVLCFGTCNRLQLLANRTITQISEIQQEDLGFINYMCTCKAVY